MSSSMMFGWTFDQWALAAGRYAECNDVMPAADSHGMFQLQAWWKARQPTAPGEVVLADVAYPMNQGWANRAWTAARIECSILPRFRDPICH